MRWKLYLLIILVLVSGVYYYRLNANTIYSREEVFSIRAIDGDTLELDNSLRIRLLGINTPEKNMPYYEEAKQFLQKLENKTIQIENNGPDKYDRILAYVYFNNNLINQEILKNGFANLYYYGTDEHYEDMKKAEQFARDNELGIWKKSENKDCLKLIKFKTDEPENLILYNNCDKQLNIIIKDDATHIYKESINQNSLFEKNFSHIWNTEGDTLYIWDEKGLIIFKRY